MSVAKRKREDFGNRVPASERGLALAIIVVSLVLGYDVLLSDRAVFVQRRGILLRLFSDEKPVVAVLHGWPVFWMFLVFVLVALMAFTFFIDHHDRRFNERFYLRLRRVMLAVTAVVILIGVISAYGQIWAS